MLVCCGDKSEVDPAHLEKLLDNISQLSEKDNDEIIDGLGAMIDKFANMDDSQKAELNNNDNGKQFVRVFFAAALYLGAKATMPESVPVGEPLTESQKEKVMALMEKYEKQAADVGRLFVNMDELSDDMSDDPLDSLPDDLSDAPLDGADDDISSEDGTDEFSQDSI